MPEVVVENEWGVVEGLTFDQVKALGPRLNTETQAAGLRLKFKPTRAALDLLVAEFGRDAFHPGCRFAWAYLYKKVERAPVDFEFVTPPYNHQREWFSLIKDLPYFALEWEMGLGKSKTVLDVCQWAYATGELDAVLVVTLKDVHRKWIDKEVPAHLPKGFADAAWWNTNAVDAGMWFGTSRARTPLIKSPKFAVASMNFNVIHRKKGEEWAKRFLSQRKCMLVVDESHWMKSPDSETTKALHRLGKLADRRMIMTGTLTGGSPLDAWAQYYFLDPKIVNGMKYWQFKSEFAVEKELPGVTYEGWETDPVTKKSVKVQKPVKTITGYKNEERLKNMLDPYRSRLLKEDCLDLPPKLYRMRSFEMSDAMRKAYTEMQSDFLAQLSDGRTMTATMAITKMLRLQQIACGFVTPDGLDPSDEAVTGEALDKNNPRVEALMQELQKVNGKGIIWSYWRYSLREIAAALREAYGDASVVEYHGGISQEGKFRAQKEFQDGSPRWFVGNPQSAGTGIDLYAAQDMFYFNNSHNLILRLQSEDRFHRIGQKGTSCTITDLECLGSVDRPQLRALKSKQDIAATISGDILKQWLTEAV